MIASRKSESDNPLAAKYTERSRQSLFRRVCDLYVGGFREMTVGRRLWALILIKLVILFLVFRLFFFPDHLKEDYDNDADRARAVRTSLTTR